MKIIRLATVTLALSLTFATLDSVMGQKLEKIEEPKLENVQATDETSPAETSSPAESKTTPKSEKEEAIGLPPAKSGISEQVKNNRPSSDMLLPASTKAWVSIPDSRKLVDEFKLTGLGQLSELPDLKPFVDSMTDKVRSMLDEQNFRLGITLDDIRNVRTGEICIAGVFSGKASHGIVILVDVDGNLDAANGLLNKLASEMEDLGAIQEPFTPIMETEVTKWRVPRIKNPNTRFDTFQTICDGWLIATDNQTVLRDVIMRIKNLGDNEALSRLINEPTFAAIRSQVLVETIRPDFQWFVEPFGYVELAQAISDQEEILHRQHDKHVERLRDNGFDMLRGIGGFVSMNNDDLEIFYRTFAYTAADQIQKQTRKRAAGIFDFRNYDKRPLTPEAFVSDDFNSHLSITWNMTSAFENIEPLVDSFGGEGTYQATLKNLRNNDIDLSSMIQNFDNQITLVTSTRHPIDERSEEIAIVLPLKGTETTDEQFAEQVRLFWSGETIVVDGINHIVIAPEEVDPEDEIILDPRFGGLEDNEVDVTADEAAQVKDIHIFEKKFITVSEKRLIIANNFELMKKLATDKPNVKLVDSEDYDRITQALSPFVKWEQVSTRQFSRIDRQLEANYEMLRQGNLVNAQTALARILNRALATEDNKPRQAEIDAHELPSDFAGVVAPYLGLSGWVMETQADGWMISGCILKKKAKTEIVEIQSEEARR